MSTLTDLFAGIAGAIRSKTGSSESIQAAQFAQAISAIPEGATVTVGNGDVSSDGNLQFPAGAASAIALINIQHTGYSEHYYIAFAVAISGLTPSVLSTTWDSDPKGNSIKREYSNITYTPDTGIMRVTLSGWKGNNYTLISW